MSSSWGNDSWQDSSFGSSSGAGATGQGMDFPVLPTIPSSGIDLGAIAPVFGVAGLDDDAADYLEYDRAGRPFMEQVQSLCGSAYFTGIFGGGAIGAVQGFGRSPSNKFKIRFNSLMNGASVRGSKAGNALGCLAILYKSFEYVADAVELEKYVKYDQVTPIVASAATGVLYKSTAGPRAMILAGALGAGLMSVVQLGVKPFYPRL